MQERSVVDPLASYWGHWLEQHFQRQRKLSAPSENRVQDASVFRENTLGYRAFQTAGKWVRGELRNMQVAGQINDDENRPKLITD